MLKEKDSPWKFNFILDKIRELFKQFKFNLSILLVELMGWHSHAKLRIKKFIVLGSAFVICYSMVSFGSFP